MFGLKFISDGQSPVRQAIVYVARSCNEGEQCDFPWRMNLFQIKDGMQSGFSS